MVRLVLCLLFAAPVGCASSNSWLTELDRDPDMRTDYTWGPHETSCLPPEMGTDTQIRTDNAEKP